MIHRGPQDVHNRVWNDQTLTWDAMAQPSTAAGGAGSTQVVARPGDTNWASSAGFHFDGSGNLQITGASASTQVSVSSLAGRVGVAPTDTSWASSAGFHFTSSGELLTAGAAAGGGSTQVSIADILTKAGGTSVMDSTQNSISVTIREGSAAGSTQVSVSTGHITVDTGSISVSNFSTTMQVSSVAGKVLVDQNSTVWSVQVSSVAGAVDVRPVAGSTFTVRAMQSSAADLQMTATPVAGSTWNVRPLQSSAADLQMTASPAAGSTWSVRPLQSSAADLQMTASPLAGSTWMCRVLQSSAADLNAQVRNFSSSGGAVDVSTTQPTGAMLGWAVRTVFPSLQSTGRSTTGNNSTRETFVSSAAGARVKVYAYSITSTAQAVNRVGWFSSNANLLWPIVMQSFSSGITGANLAVSPPAWLFATDAANALTFGITGTTGTYNVGVSWFTDT